MDIFPAHIRDDNGKRNIQPCEEHCKNVAEYTSQMLKGIGLSECGYLIGLLHDSGKFSEEFRDYIYRAADGVSVRRGSVNHSSLGLEYILNEFFESGE